MPIFLKKILEADEPKVAAQPAAPTASQTDEHQAQNNRLQHLILHQPHLNPKINKVIVII